jgi:hypothetical protein
LVFHPASLGPIKFDLRRIRAGNAAGGGDTIAQLGRREHADAVTSLGQLPAQGECNLGATSGLPRHYHRFQGRMITSAGDLRGAEPTHAGLVLDRLTA